jgi:hypothetical protein
MTAARVLEPGPGRADWEVVFLESARFYRLVGSPAAVDSMVQTLIGALGRGGRVTVRLVSLGGADIDEVRAPGDAR